MNKYPTRLLCALAAAALLGACASTESLPDPATDVVTATPAQMLAAIEAAAVRDGERELAVQPLRDPEVEDLRESAKQAVAAGRVAQAVDDLNQALLVVPDDPSILQERAEVAIRQSEFDRAETLAQRALELGSKVGPLCRRHWETIRQVRERRLEIASASQSGERAEDTAKRASHAAYLAMKVAEATGGLNECTVPGLNRM